MAVENDYNLLVHNLNELQITSLRDEVQRRRLLEAHDRLEPNHTDWVNLIGLQLLTVAPIFNGLQADVSEVLGERARRSRLHGAATSQSRLALAVFAPRDGEGC